MQLHKQQICQRYSEKKTIITVSFHAASGQEHLEKAVLSTRGMH